MIESKFKLCSAFGATLVLDFAGRHVMTALWIGALIELLAFSLDFIFQGLAIIECPHSGRCQREDAIEIKHLGVATEPFDDMRLKRQDGYTQHGDKGQLLDALGDV